jgi:hypothetical protein
MPKMIRIWNYHICYVLVFASLSLAQGFTTRKEKRAESLEVVFPVAGDTIVCGGNWNILWKNGTASDKNVTISLRQGSAENVSVVSIVASKSIYLPHPKPTLIIV